MPELSPKAKQYDKHCVRNPTVQQPKIAIEGCGGILNV